jgi:pyruvate/2-oxoglutarate dehydrogenase complex dihydrolipoamide dehydrogenase (E3) component
MKIAILSRRPKLYSTRRLEEEAKKRGHQVKIIDTYFYSDGTKATKTLTETYFRTQFCNQKSNESLGRDLVKLFKKEGFIIDFAFWYD